MLRIGLTGGIGCGKSYVAGIIRRHGIPVYDCDSNAKRITSADEAVVADLKALVGESLYASGELDRHMLAEFIFGNEDNMRAVNAVIHPRVKADFLKWAEQYDMCVMESAILYESDFQDSVQVVVAVDAPDELRVRRCMARDGVGRESILARMASQMPQKEKCRRADFVIVNDDVQDLDSQICAILDKCKNIFK